MNLLDVIDIFIPGDWGNDTITNETINEVFCIRGADIVPINNHDFTKIPQRYVSDKTLNNKTLQVGDLVIEKSGGSPTQSTGRIVYISKELIENKKNIVCSNFCTAFRVKPIWNPLYIYYYWKYLYNNDIFFKFEGKTSGIKNLQLENALSTIKIQYIPITEQNKIVDILSSLDQKIALNRQINQNLEAMAKQLYDYWFVQFDFPDENGKPYKSSGGKMVYNEKLKREIPEGWEVKNLNDIVKVKDGTHDSPKQQNEGYFLITSKHLLSTGIDFKTAYYISIEDYDAINKRSKVDTNDILFSMIGTVGNKYLVSEETINFAIKNMALIKSSENEKFMYFLWFYLSSSDYMSYEHNAMSGSIQKFLSLDAMRKIPVLFNEKILILFNKKVNEICKLISKTNNQNVFLTQQRDELLPLLMNGQVSVVD